MLWLVWTLAARPPDTDIPLYGCGVELGEGAWPRRCRPYGPVVRIFCTTVSAPPTGAHHLAHASHYNAWRATELIRKPSPAVVPPTRPTTRSSTSLSWTRNLRPRHARYADTPTPSARGPPSPHRVASATVALYASCPCIQPALYLGLCISPSISVYGLILESVEIDLYPGSQSRCSTHPSRYSHRLNPRTVPCAPSVRPLNRWHRSFFF